MQIGIRTRFETTNLLIGYKWQGEGFADLTREIEAGKILWAKFDDRGTRRVGDRDVQVVLFNIEGGDEYYWSPRDEFSALTRRVAA
jgi:hypothetical protein